LVGVLALPALRDGDDASVRQPGRPVRPPARAALGARAVPARRAVLRRGAHDAAADRGAGAAGAGRRGTGAGLAHGAGGPVRAARAAARAGLVQRDLGLRGADRPAGRGLADAELRLALGLLDHAAAGDAIA